MIKKKYLLTLKALKPKPKKDRLLDNYKAEQLVKSLKDSGATPSDEDIEILKGYTGRGGIDNNDNEYFTPIPVAAASWSLMDTEEGDVILDPSIGTGVFSSTAPPQISLKGADINSVSAFIAQATNSNTTAVSEPFEQMQKKILPFSLDGLITNVPFGARPAEYKAIDRDDIHLNEDYFILKGLEKLKAGKVGIFLTTSSTAQRKGNERTSLRKKASLLGSFRGGYRLPSATFEDTGTNQVVDILVWEKHPDDVVKRGEQITPESWHKMLEEKTNKDFIDGVYFSSNPDKIIGDFISMEEHKERAVAHNKNLKDGEKEIKMHHHLQKDSVSLPAGKTREEVIAGMGEYIKKLPENQLDYSKLDYGLKPKTKSPLSPSFNTIDPKAITFLKAEIDKMIVGDMNLEGYQLTLNQMESLGTDFSTHFDIGEREILQARVLVGRKGYDLLLSAFFTDKVRDVDYIMRNKDTIQKLVSNIKIFKGSEICLRAIRQLSKFDFDEKNFVNLEEQEVKEETRTQKQGFYDKKDFTKTELESGEYIVFGDKVQSKEDFLSLQDGLPLSNVLNTLFKTDTPKKGRHKLQDQIENDYSTKQSVDTFDIPISLYSRIFGYYEAKRMIGKLIKNRVLKSQWLRNCVNLLQEELDSVQFKDWTPSMVSSNILKSKHPIAFMEHLFYDKSMLIFEKNTDGNIKSVIRKAMYQVKPIIQVLVNEEVRGDPTRREKLREYLDKARVVKFSKAYDEDRSSELSSSVRAEWLDKAHHYQNSDSRKLAREMAGGLNHATGLGKSVSAFLTALQMIHQGTAKRVLYVVMNATFAKMGKEAEKFFTKEQMDKCLFINSKNATDIAKLMKSKEWEFIIMANSTLTNSIKLTDESTKAIYGSDDKNIDTIDDISKPNNLRKWVSSYPKYSKNAIYNFEDLGIDAMILDENQKYRNAISSSKSVKGLNAKSSNESLIVLMFSEYIKGIKRGDMRGVIGSSATPVSNSPSEILTQLLFTTDRKGFGHVHSRKDFESNFFDVGEDSVLKTDGVTLINKTVLLGVKNINALYDMGYDKNLFRTAEEEQANAAQKGRIIKTKPTSTEISSVAEHSHGVDEMYSMLSELQGELSNFEKAEREDQTMKSMIYKEFTMFGTISKLRQLSISKKASLGYTEILVKDAKQLPLFLSAIQKVKVGVKHGKLKKTRLGGLLDVKTKKVAIEDVPETEYYKLKEEIVPETLLPISETFPDGTAVINIPTIVYKEIKDVFQALKKAKLYKDGDEVYKEDSHPKYALMLDNMQDKIKDNPHAKQIVYSTSLHTHSLIEKMVKFRFGAKTKTFIFNDAHIKKDEERFKIQEDFNKYSKFGVMIYGIAGQVGVDFNKNVNAVHLMDVGNKPADREQAKGRAVRQGNPLHVDVFNYTTHGTFDLFLEELVANKSSWIDAVNSKDHETMFSADTIEELSSKAQIKYQNLDISMTDKIKMYIAFVADAEREKNKQVSNSLFADGVAKYGAFYGKFARLKEYGVLSVYGFIQKLGDGSQEFIQEVVRDWDMLGGMTLDYPHEFTPHLLEKLEKAVAYELSPIDDNEKMEKLKHRVQGILTKYFKILSHQHDDIMNRKGVFAKESDIKVDMRISDFRRATLSTISVFSDIGMPSKLNLHVAMYKDSKIYKKVENNHKEQSEWLTNFLFDLVISNLSKAKYDLETGTQRQEDFLKQAQSKIKGIKELSEEELIKVLLNPHSLYVASDGNYHYLEYKNHEFWYVLVYHAKMVLMHRGIYTRVDRDGHYSTGIYSMINMDYAEITPYSKESDLPELYNEHVQAHHRYAK